MGKAYIGGSGYSKTAYKLESPLVIASVTRLGDLLDYGQLFKAVLRQFL